ncbi:MAG: hypothetical protein IJA97_04280 [Clostridia bacterium]|nr:hypothetical protein [Clostridia bacterium]
MIVKLIAPSMIKYSVLTEMISDRIISEMGNRGYQLKRNGNKFETQIECENYTFQIFDNGIIVFNYAFELSDATPYTEILLKKEEYTKKIIDRNGAIVLFLKLFEDCIKNVIPTIKESYFFNGKYVSYCLTTYNISENYKDTAYSLALKRKISNDQIANLCEQSLKVVNVNEHTQILLIWGARIVIGDDAFSFNLFNDYVMSESEAQYLWFIITSLDKKIDNYMINETGRVADLSMLLDTSYSVLYRKSKFDGVVSSKSHRYEIEIFNSIVTASKIDYSYDNLEKKIRLLKEKSSLVEEKINTKNRKFVNILLGVISLLSAISTVYGFISVFQNGNEKITYLIVTIVAVILFAGANIFQHIGVRKSQKTKNKKIK